MITYRDLYIIQCLLQETEKSDTKVFWQRPERGSYWVNFNEDKSRVRVEVSMVQARPSRVVAKFSSPGLGEVQIVEPIKNIFSLMTKYDTPEDEELAETIKRLLGAVSRQHAQREIKDEETTEERKQAIFRRLIGGGSAD